MQLENTADSRQVWHHMGSKLTLTGYVTCFGNNNKIHPFVYKEWLKKMFAVICSAGIWRSAY